MTLKRESAGEAWIFGINVVLEDFKNKVTIHKYIYSSYLYAVQYAKISVFALRCAP
jgi:hypothetical protein